MWIFLILAYAVYPSQQCNYNWQCSSLLCQNGHCIDDTLQNSFDSGRGSLFSSCNKNPDCESSCCFQDVCTPSILCQDQCSDATCKDILSQQRVQQKLEQARAAINLRSIDNLRTCNYHFECKSKCCLNGACNQDSQGCNEIKEVNSFCYYDADCCTDCCVDNQCAPTYMCSLNNMNSTPCQFNYQCQQNCCQKGVCSSSPNQCQNKLDTGSSCKNNESCTSSCCDAQICVHSANCFGLDALIREDAPHLAVFYSYLSFHSHQNKQTSERALQAKSKASLVSLHQGNRRVIWSVVCFILVIVILGVASILIRKMNKVSNKRQSEVPLVVPQV